MTSSILPKLMIASAAPASADSRNADADLLHRLGDKPKHRTSGADACPLPCAHAPGRDGSGPHPGCSLEEFTTVSFHLYDPSICACSSWRRPSATQCCDTEPRLGIVRHYTTKPACRGDRDKVACRRQDRVIPSAASILPGDGATDPFEDLLAIAASRAFTGARRSAVEPILREH